MDNKNTIGELISTARKKKKLTQQELAKLLMVTDKAVSNWETGKNYPDIAILKNISKYLDIDLLSIIVEKDKKNSKKYIKHLLTVASIIFLVLFILLSTYFFNNYNKNTVYKLSLDSNEYELYNGLIIVSNNKIALSLGEISGISGETYDITLKYTEDNQSKEIISKFNYDNLFIEDEIDGTFFGKNLISNLNNLTISITYFDNNDKRINVDLKLKVEKKYTNNKLIYKASQKSNNNYLNERTKILLHNVGYKKIDTNLYSKEIKNDEIITILTYDIKDKTYTMNIIEEDIEKNGKYYIEENRLEYTTKYKEYVIEEFIYEKEITCYLGECNNGKELIDEFFEQYNLLK